MKRALVIMGVLVSFLFFASMGLTAPEFYEGKTVRLSVGFSAGGGFDLWARLVSRHWENISRVILR